LATSVRSLAAAPSKTVIVVGRADLGGGSLFTASASSGAKAFAIATDAGTYSYAESYIDGNGDQRWEPSGVSVGSYDRVLAVSQRSSTIGFSEGAVHFPDHADAGTAGDGVLDAFIGGDKAGTALLLGRIAEVLVYVPALTAVEAEKVQVNLSAKYGLQTPRMLFITSLPHNGNLGGIEGAEELCMLRATAAGWKGSWNAVLATSYAGAAANVGGSTTAKIVDTSGNELAEDLNDMWDGVNLVPTDEYGAAHPGATPWSAIDATGNLFGSDTCDDWQGGDAYIYGGTASQGNATTLAWLAVGGSKSCALPHEIYCLSR
jgi:hypothetical protein